MGPRKEADLCHPSKKGILDAHLFSIYLYWFPVASCVISLSSNRNHHVCTSRRWLEGSSRGSRGSRGGMRAREQGELQGFKVPQDPFLPLPLFASLLFLFRLDLIR